MSLLSLLNQKISPKWEVWREIPPEGELEHKLGGFPSEPDAALDYTRNSRDLLIRIYASVKEECLKDHPNKVHVVVLSPYSPTGNHLILTYPCKTFNDKAKRRLREQGYDDGLKLYHQPEPVEPLHLFTPF